MIEIGRNYLRVEDGTAKLCADVSIRGVTRTLWFGVGTKMADRLTIGRADPFLVVLLPCAMMMGDETIVCCDEVSARLYFGLNEFLIPALEKKKGKFKKVSIQAKVISSPIMPASRVQAAVGVGFSGGVDCLYSVMRHGEDSLFPVTHLAVFNSGVFEGNIRSNFKMACSRCRTFADSLGLETVFVDSNIPEVMDERFLDVYSFRNLGYALALQRLFSVYLLSSGHDAGHFSIDPDNSATYDMVTVNSVCTESLTFYLSGAETPRSEKIEALSQWEQAYSWLHPCIKGFAGGKNCGRCKKCVRDMTTLFCLGKLERFSSVFDVNDYRKHLPQKMAFVLANRGNHLFDETIALMGKDKSLIPNQAFRLAEVFRQVIDETK